MICCKVKMTATSSTTCVWIPPHQTLQISTTGVLNSTGSNADVTIKLENGSGGNADLSSLGSTSTQIVNSLIAGADPIVKIDHS